MASVVASVVRVALIVGTVDITENLIFNAFRHIAPILIFQYMASGLTGMWAFHAGLESVALGAAIHYTITLFWTAVYYAASRWWSVLIRRPVVCGLLYGAVVGVVMDFLVLPLTRLPHPPAAGTVAARINGVAALLFCIGLMIGLSVSRERRREA